MSQVRKLTGFVAALSLAALINTPSFASDGIEAPSAAQLERVLRKALTSDRQRPSLLGAPGSPPSYVIHRNGNLLSFELRDLTRLGKYYWRTKLTLKFGPRPPQSGIIVMESEPRGLYTMDVDKQSGEWRLRRFNRVAVMQLLPTALY